MTTKLKTKNVKPKMELLKATTYKDSMIYIRRINKNIFEYLAVYEGQIYTSYLIINPKNGSKSLTKSEVNQSAALIFNGAVTTIDMLTGSKLTESAELQAKDFEKVGKGAFSKDN